MWNINGSKWCKPFVNSTKGFVDEISESDKAQLEKINSVREQVITPILKFKNAVKNADAKGICTAIYNSLIDFRVDEQIRKYAVGLSELNQNALAAEQGRVWDMVMEILNQMSSAIYGEKIMLKEFAKLFSLVISTEDLGTLPQGIDNVQFGQADRIRTDNPSAVFILGANEGEFPQTISKGGILSEADRQILLKNDFKLYSYGEILNIQERYFAYMACAAPRDYLHISYIGNSSREVAPSEIVTSVKSALPDIATVNCNSISDIDLIETKETAFELMSEHYFDTDVFYSSLKEYFSNDMRFPAIKSLAEDEQIKIKNNKTATELFNYNMLVSDSRIEDFYNCPFRYFCKFGLSAKPREKAEMNPMQRGTIIHYVLEMILSNYGSKKLSDMTKCEIKNLVDGYIQSYFTEQMGNVEDLSVRFKYNYIRLSKMIYGVVEQLADEFSNSDFEAKAFELKIDKDADVKPEIITLDDGGTVQIRGFIDRVDTFTKDNQRYVRVVDYKSGNKDFNLSDIMYGLNLQMFVYLFSLCSDKTAKLNGIPAGVLYMHASRNIVSFHSKSEAEMYASSDKSNSLKMKGIVLSDENNEIPKAMEHDLEGKYIPVKLKRNGELYGQFASLEQLGLLHKKINALIAEMGTELHMGNVSQNPVKNKNHKMTCEYCDYSDVCAGRRTIDERIAEDLTDDEVKTILSREFEENATMDTATE
ncbi:MAG: PD-(D/E)XK nuclease family protein [Clostridiales bacterium]|nr:PD-(D/E)XK nuclease family protein [Clostridiales bacterium]